MSNPYDWGQLEQAAQDAVYVSTNEELLTYCDHWLTLPMIAIDTEFQRVDTFYPIPGLIQVADDQRCYLIDPLSVTDFEPLVNVFNRQSVLKIIHAGSEDLELFNHSLGAIPAPIFDTQLAAAFAGWGFTMGLQRLVESALGVQLGKGETTSDWLKRPLSADQELYAALDVAYLPALCQKLAAELTEKGVLGWFEEESQVALAHVEDQDPTGFEYYLRFSQMWGLPDHKMAALRDLTAWREQQSRGRDVPRNRILRNQSLLTLIQRWPRNRLDLSRIPELRSKVIREDGDTILEILSNAKQSAEQNPVEPIPRPLPVYWNKRLKKLKAMARAAAEQKGIAPELMLKKKDLELLVRSREWFGAYRLPEGLAGWRKEIIGQALLEQLELFEQQD
jgi:ribonuclease D